MHLLRPTILTILVSLLSIPQISATTYDYAIAGSGTSGLLLALALTQNPSITVVVLEAGSDARTDPRITVPEREGSIAGTTYDWNFTTTPQPGLYGGKSIPVARGKVLGGTSAMNWMIWHRASSVEFDAWESMLGNQGWDWDAIFAGAIASETFFVPPTNMAGIETYDSSYHGTSGPIDGSMAKGVFSLYTDYLIPTLKTLGVPIPIDRDGGNITGAGFVPLAINPSSYTRSYPGSAYTLAQNRTNLHLVTNAQVSRIVWSPTKSGSNVVAQGLAYMDATLKSGPEKIVYASNIILSAGVFQTPQLLELSGVGDPKYMTPLGISTIVNLPAVGTKIADHPTYAGIFSFNKTGFTGGNYAQNFLDYAPASRFLSASDHAAAAAMLNSSTSTPAGSSAAAFTMLKHLFFADEPLIEYGWFQGFSTAYLLHPLSQGTVHINSSNPFSAPRINPGYNTAIINGTQFDLWLLAKAVQYYGTALPKAYPFNSIAAKYSLNVSLPFSDFQTQVAKGLGSGAHFTGGAVMLPRAKGGVVGRTLKVYGTSNVRVVDLSIVPASPGQHVMGLAYAIAMRAAAIFRG